MTVAAHAGGMRWIGLVFGVVTGSVVAAYLSVVVEVDRARIRPRD